MATLSTDLVPFEDAATLPALITVPDDEFGTGQRRGFPVISIKGKVFSVTRSGERKMEWARDANGRETKSPATELNIIILRAAPGLSKTYYDQPYEEGKTEKPTCYSNDGKAPAADAQHPQAKACQTCVHNQWGAKINAAGKKTKACSDIKKLAVAPLGDPEDAMLLRVPPASLKGWDQYVADLKRRGRNPTAVATRLSFQFEEAHPLLTFEGYAGLGASLQATVAAMRESDIVQSILDTSMNAVAELEGEADPLPELPVVEVEKPKVAAKAAPKAAPKAKPVETLEEVVAKVAQDDPLDIQVEEGDDIIAGLDSLGDLTFDD